MEAVKDRNKTQTKPDGAGKRLFFSPTPIQHKLKVNTPGDKYEVEADQVAEQVVERISTSDIELSPIDKKPKQKSDKNFLMTKRTSSDSPSVSPPTSTKLFASKGKGDFLPTNTRSEMEMGFQKDFSNVKIHTDSSANTMTKNLGAKAFTHGSDIYFNSGKFNPNTQGGKKLLAHELTHVIQESNLIRRDPDEEAKKQEEEKIATLKSQIKTAFSLKSVEDGSSNWTSEELGITKEAIEKISTVDIPALKDVVLKRVSSLGGKTAGEFSSQQSVDDTSVTNDYELSLADLNFKQGSSEEEQKRLVQHEVGHAIASLPSRQANLTSNKALAEYNSKMNKQNESVLPFNEANDEFNTAVGEYNDKVNEYNSESDPTIKKQLKVEADALVKVVEQKRAERTKKEKVFNTDEAATKVAKTTSDTKEKEAKKHAISQADLDVIKQTASSAKSSHDTIMTQVMGTITAEMKNLDVANKYLISVQTLSTEIEKFYSETIFQEKSEADVENLISEVDKKTADRTKAFETLSNADKTHSLLTTLTSLEKEQEKFFHAAKANALAHERSARVQKFVAFVESNHIQPISAYARENWPHKPEEFYAEAYSFWTSKKLNAVSPDLQKWFDAKKYK